LELVEHAEALHKNFRVGTCSTFFQEIHDGVAGASRVWLEKLEAELVFRIWRCVKLCQTHPNFQLKSLLQALKKMAACNTHPASIDCCKMAVITWSFVKKMAVIHSPSFKMYL
jgi:hypothetical protein